MKGMGDMLAQEKERLEAIISKVKANLQDTPEGTLRISRGKVKPRYYQCVDGDRSGTYIKKEEDGLPAMLAQKTYDLQVLRKAEARLKQIRKIAEDYRDDEIEKIYSSMSDERKNLVNPVEPPWEELVREWMSVPYQGKPFDSDLPLILTNKGERVRSKSEKTLADYFYMADIPYKYECPLSLKPYGVIYPDFTVLSRKTGKPVYWEHFGRMDDSEYAKKTVKKIELYESNGYFPGDGLIATYETGNFVLNTQIIERQVKRFLL